MWFYNLPDALGFLHGRDFSGSIPCHFRWSRIASYDRNFYRSNRTLCFYHPDQDRWLWMFRDCFQCEHFQEPWSQYSPSRIAVDYHLCRVASRLPRNRQRDTCRCHCLRPTRQRILSHSITNQKSLIENIEMQIEWNMFLKDCKHKNVRK